MLIFKKIVLLLTSKVDNSFFLHYQDLFWPILTCLCPIVVTSSILIEKKFVSLNYKMCFTKHKLVHAFSHGSCTCVVLMMMKVVKHLDKIK